MNECLIAHLSYAYPQPVCSIKSAQGDSKNTIDRTEKAARNVLNASPPAQGHSPINQLSSSASSLPSEVFNPPSSPSVVREGPKKFPNPLLKQ